MALVVDGINFVVDFWKIFIKFWIPHLKVRGSNPLPATSAFRPNGGK